MEGESRNKNGLMAFRKDIIEGADNENACHICFNNVHFNLTFILSYKEEKVTDEERTALSQIIREHNIECTFCDQSATANIQSEELFAESLATERISIQNDYFIRFSYHSYPWDE
jgi:predicted molibdopterin-dependent oxidoreductase YjgC